MTITDEEPCRRNVGRDSHDPAVRISIGDLLDQGPNRRRVVNDEKTYHVHGGRAFASARTAPERYRVIEHLANGLRSFDQPLGWAFERHFTYPAALGRRVSASAGVITGTPRLVAAGR